jgi:hypothetical protein
VSVRSSLLGWGVLSFAAVVLVEIRAANPSGVGPAPSATIRLDEASASSQVQQRRTFDAKGELRKGLALLIDGDQDVTRLRADDASEDREAISWLRRAADHGDYSAKFHLARWYWSANDVANERKALRLFLDVANTGDPYAAHYVAGFFRDGIGMPRDLRKARTWDEVAAKGGLSNSAWRLAWMFEHATGVRRDVVEAYKWFDVATHLAPLATEPQETSGAAKSRDALAKTMSPDELSQAQARSRAWLASNSSFDSCNAQQARIRLVVTLDEPKNIDSRPWIQSVEEQLKKYVKPPPCSRIESRGVITLRLNKGAGNIPPYEVNWASPLFYFDFAVVAALRQVRLELPPAFPSESLEFTIRAFYNELPWPAPSKH